MIKGTKHRILEIEFYFKSEKHPDPYPHVYPIEKDPAVWYFHRHGNHYRPGNYKGLDITIGNGDDWRGGVLIRTIEEVRPSF